MIILNRQFLSNRMNGQFAMRMVWAHMTKTFVADLYGPLSHVRLETYREAGGNDLAMVTNYFWNLRLAESLVPALHAVEIALRNINHAALSDRYDTDMWIYRDGLLRANQLRDFASAMGRIANKPTPLAGRVVAQLSFGFWTSLLNSPYERLCLDNGFCP